MKPEGFSLKKPRDSVAEEQRRYSTSLIQAISDVFENKAAIPGLPKGIEKIERVTLEAVRIRLTGKVDEELLSQIAEDEGYAFEKGTWPLRVIKEGATIARVGSRSDAGGRLNLYIYPFPPEMEKISVYRRMLAEREGILDPSLRKIDLESLHEFNLQLMRLLNRYLKERYG